MIDNRDRYRAIGDDLNRRSAILTGRSAIASVDRRSQAVNRRSQASIGNLKRQSAINKSAIGNRQSAVS
jgi:hypothetical protein